MIPHDLLQTLLRRTGFEEGHRQTLLRLSGVMSPLASEVALAFYDYLGRDSEMHQILWATPGRVERLYGKFAQWYRDLFVGQYDQAYAQGRYRIGLIHARLGVSSRFTMPAMGIVQELSLEHLQTALKPSELGVAVEAFEKIMVIEIALMEESYRAAVEAAWQAGVASDQALARGAELLLQESFGGKPH